VTSVARERHPIFSVYPEVRVAGWLGAMLIATGAGILIKQNLDPRGLSILLGVASVACYGWAVWRRGRATLVDDSVLLLGALLLSADIAFIETQFHLLGSRWPSYFLAIAVVHGAGAYFFRSRTLLSLSITALAAWIGVERRGLLDFADTETAVRALLCAAIVLVWRFADARVWTSPFTRVFEHFAANLALFAGVSMAVQRDTRLAGVALTLVLAAFVVVYGFREGHEPFVLYGYCYAVFAVDVLVFDVIRDEDLRALFLIVFSIAAIVGLFFLHARFRRR
jgi:hypothetical protein